MRIGFNQGLSHRIEAGSDFYLMPSRFEPCGLNQMYSQRYGAVPVVRITGGLDDTVVDISEDPASATGIKFAEYSARALAKAMRKALVLYDEPRLLRHYRHNGMKADFSWDRMVKQYRGHLPAAVEALMKPSYLILLVVMNCFWAGTLSVYKALAGHLEVGGIVTLRFGVAAVLLMACWPWLPGKTPRGFDLLKTLGMGLIVFMLGQRLQVYGNKLGTAGNSSVLMGAEPLVTSVAAALFLHEHIGPRRWMGFALGMLGVALVNHFCSPASPPAPSSFPRSSVKPRIPSSANP